MSLLRRLGERFHWASQELLVHTAAREGLLCSTHCLMPDTSLWQPGELLADVFRHGGAQARAISGRPGYGGTKLRLHFQSSLRFNPPNPPSQMHYRIEFIGSAREQLGPGHL
jgi:hypothetical protein